MLHMRLCHVIDKISCNNNMYIIIIIIDAFCVDDTFFRYLAKNLGSCHY